MNSDKNRYFRQRSTRRILGSIISASVTICVYLWLIFLLSCSSKPTNLRTLAPADSLIYLETNDLGAALEPIIDSRAFTDVAKKKPDLSALRGVQLAVAVTGFETKEEKLNEENSIGRVQPHFAAIADTHAWSWQARNFAENQLGEFINSVYGGGINLDTSPKDGGVSYVWTAEDGRKAYAFVDGNLIFFGNDQSAIDKCLAVKRGEAESIAKNPKLPQADPNNLAFGYVTSDGVSQIASIVGMTMAAQTGEEEEVKSFIAGVLPQLLRSSVSDVSWTATKTDERIEDKYLISTVPDVSNVLNQTMAAGDESAPITEVTSKLLANLPADVTSVTRYNLKDPQVAWRSVVLLAQKQAEGTSGKILGQFSSALFEPYGIRDPESFLAAVGDSRTGRNLVTAKLDAEGDRLVVVATRGAKDAEMLKALTSTMRPPKTIVEGGTNAWSAASGDLEAVFEGDALGIGSKSDLEACLFWSPHEAAAPLFKGLISSKAPITTVTQERELGGQIAELLSEKKTEDAVAVTTYTTETSFTKNGIQRRTVSDFGLIGALIAQLAPEN